MILLETSILTIAFGQRPRRRPEPKAVDDLRQMIADDWPLAIPGIVIQEILAGAMDENQLGRLAQNLRTFPAVFATGSNHLTAARIAMSCRNAGVKCATIDALIAAIAVDTKALLFTLDRVFSKIAPFCGLRLYETGMIARIPKPN